MAFSEGAAVSLELTADQAAPAQPAATARPRLLIVDDIADNREILARRFERRGFEVIEADSGFRALALIEEREFDVVLLDVMMPEMDGLETLRRIRHRSSSAILPV